MMKKLKFIGLVSAGGVRVLDKTGLKFISVHDKENNLPKNIQNIFVARVDGRSMESKNIFDKDYLLFRKGGSLNQGDIVLIDRGKNKRFLRIFEKKTPKNFKVKMKNNISYIDIDKVVGVYKYLEKIDFGDTKRFGLQNRRYIGNKYKITDWIFDLISKECEGDSFADLFAGTGAVSKTAIENYENVIINDFLYSNNLIHKAFFLKGKANDEKLENHIERFNLIDRENLKENYFSINFGGKYFSKNDCKSYRIYKRIH